ncbi:protein translocase subunit SecF [Perlucidibaca piscinae]|uniref:protein translocase subunit SecF n=1 Tax=Perlucidibaca piscinae TaxID=392589 RepID=UPI0003B799A7|nr:protein translocase subunit SecF [Perlucidibaca piscinae]
MADVRVIRFMRYRRLMAVLSGAIVLVGLVAIVLKGLNLGLDFTGGTSVEFRFAQAAHQAEVSRALDEAGYEDAVVQYLGDATSIQVRLPNQPGDAASVAQRMAEAVSSPANPARVMQVDSVGAQIGDELYLNSLIAVGLSLAMMMAYVSIRYQYKFAIGAVLSLVHDVLFTVGLFALFGLPFDLTVLAAVLALIGYSLNDTVVVFDRIRENFRKLRKADTVEVIDISLTETLSRTINTVLTVVLVVLALLFVGGPALHWFAVALLIGLFAGTYSSIYIATAYALFAGISRDDFIVQVKKAEDELP